MISASFSRKTFWRRVLRHPIERPGLQRPYQRFLHDIFGQGEVFDTKNSCQGSHHFSRFMPEKVFHHLGNFRRRFDNNLGCGFHSTSRHGTDNQERFLAVDHGGRQPRPRRFEGQILFARKKSYERASFQGVVVAKRPA
jgi:hypothetical protein